MKSDKRSIALRDIQRADLPIFFEHQRDPVANEMAAFAARSQDAFMNHWLTKVLGNNSAQKKTILVDSRVAGYIVCWDQAGKHLVGYWIGREYWGKGIATDSLGQFLSLLKIRPLYAYVATHNVASIRVLEKCGFKQMGKSDTFDDRQKVTIEEELWTLRDAHSTE